MLSKPKNGFFTRMVTVLPLSGLAEDYAGAFPHLKQRPVTGSWTHGTRKDRITAQIRMRATDIMKVSTFASPIEDLYFEDYVVGVVHEFGCMSVEEEEIIAFAKRFDPQPFHTDPETAKHTVYRGLIASGWHTASLSMRLLVDHFVSHVASLGSPGVDEIRWLQPVRPRDTLSLRVTVLEAMRSQSKPDRGTIRTFVEVLNQRCNTVMTMKATGLIRSRGNGSRPVSDEPQDRESDPVPHPSPL